jgi:hypothetical protein
MRALLCALALAGGAKPWPLTASELESQDPKMDQRIEESAPCTGKAALELRLFARVKEGPQLRLTAKNCTAKPLKLLFDNDLQPSRLEFKGKVKAPFDERSRRKFDNTVRARSFTVLEAGQERLLIDDTFHREGDGYSLAWGPFRFETIPLGKQSLHAVLDAWIDAAVGEDGKSAKVENAAVGSFKSNEVTITLP